MQRRECHDCKCSLSVDLLQLDIGSGGIIVFKFPHIMEDGWTILLIHLGEQHFRCLNASILSQNGMNCCSLQVYEPKSEGTCAGGLRPRIADYPHLGLGSLLYFHFRYEVK